MAGAQAKAEIEAMKECCLLPHLLSGSISDNFFIQPLPNMRSHPDWFINFILHIAKYFSLELDLKSETFCTAAITA